MAYFSKLWADILASAYVRNSKSFIETEDIQYLSKYWRETEHDVLDILYAENPAMRMLNQRKLESRGGAATLCGLELNLLKMHWKTFAIGDSCLFHLQSTGKSWSCQQHPNIASDDFGVTPELISTFHESTHNWKAESASGDFKIGDQFILATDAISKWIVEEHEGYEQNEKLSDLLSITCYGEFDELITHERSLQRMDDDDVTVLVISITKPGVE